METKQATANRIIDALGGTFAVSRMCANASPQAVSDWRKKGLPPAREQLFRYLRPDLFRAAGRTYTPAEGAVASNET